MFGWPSVARMLLARRAICVFNLVVWPWPLSLTRMIVGSWYRGQGARQNVETEIGWGKRGFLAGLCFAHAALDAPTNSCGPACIRKRAEPWNHQVEMTSSPAKFPLRTDLTPPDRLGTRCRTWLAVYDPVRPRTGGRFEVKYRLPVNRSCRQHLPGHEMMRNRCPAGRPGGCMSMRICGRDLWPDSPALPLGPD